MGDNVPRFTTYCYKLTPPLAGDRLRELPHIHTSRANPQVQQRDQVRLHRLAEVSAGDGFDGFVKTFVSLIAPPNVSLIPPYPLQVGGYSVA